MESVIFRADRRTGIVLAVFPEDPFSLAGDSYFALTWHGMTQVGFGAYHTTRPAKPHEYADMLASLGRSRYRVMKRITGKMMAAYNVALREARATVRRESDCQLPADRDMNWAAHA